MFFIFFILSCAEDDTVSISIEDRLPGGVLLTRVELALESEILKRDYIDLEYNDENRPIRIIDIIESDSNEDGIITDDEKSVIEFRITYEGDHIVNYTLSSNYLLINLISTTFEYDEQGALIF
ncbi:MAG: hypothetical protein ABJG47_11540 [Ekhidna sp.]